MDEETISVSGEPAVQESGEPLFDYHVLPSQTLRDTYEQRAKYYLPDEYYISLLNRLIPHGEEIMREALKYGLGTKSITDSFVSEQFWHVAQEKDYVREIIQYHEKHPWGIDLGLKDDGEPKSQYEFVQEMLFRLPKMYKEYPGLTFEKYIELCMVYNDEKWCIYPYRKVVIAGKIDKNSRKLTYEDIKRITQTSTNSYELMEAIEKIQPYCDESGGSGIIYIKFYPTTGNTSEAITIYVSPYMEVYYKADENSDPELMGVF